MRQGEKEYSNCVEARGAAALIVMYFSALCGHECSPTLTILPRVFAGRHACSCLRRPPNLPSRPHFFLIQPTSHPNSQLRL